MFPTLVSVADDALAVHPDGAWRDRADYVLRARIDELPDDPDAWEQMWGRSLGDRRFEICCIPFLAYDLALGDVVVIDDDDWIVDVVERSGHRTFRVWTAEASDAVREHLHLDLVGVGAGIECRSASLMAVDACDESTAQAVWSILIRYPPQHPVEIEGPFP